MAPIEIWGPNTWNLFHTLVENIKEESFQYKYNEIFFFIKRICYYLPCPTCREDAIQILSTIKPHHISTKEKFRHVIFTFHNHVNKKKYKKQFNIENVIIYKEYNLIQIFNKFASSFNVGHDFNELHNSMQRKGIITQMIKWIKQNYLHFDFPNK